MKSQTPFGARLVYEIFTLSNGGVRGASWRNRIVVAYVNTFTEMEAYRKADENRGKQLTFQKRWAVRMPGGWYVLGSVSPIHIRGQGEADRYREIAEAIRNECAPALIHIIEGQAEALRQQGELLDRCIQVLKHKGVDKHLITDIINNLTEVPDGHEDETVRRRVAGHPTALGPRTRAASRAQRSAASDARASGSVGLGGPEDDWDDEPD